jgi:hypothetical protein
MQDKIIEMLGRGITATQVAAAVGCDDSYISQLMSSPEIAERVANLRAVHFSHYVEQDKELDSAEEEALNRLKQLVPFITKPGEAARVYGVLNAAKRRTADSSAIASAPAQTVTLELPEAARVSFTITHDRQVIEIAGRSMTTMPAKSLAAQLEQRNAQRLLDMKPPASLLNGSQQPINVEDARMSKKNTTLVSQL